MVGLQDRTSTCAVWRGRPQERQPPHLGEVSSSASLLGDYWQEWRGSKIADFAGRLG
jgi:hypothetical protein